LGSSTFAGDVTLGTGYDVLQDERDLQFTYTTLAGEKAAGVVSYVNLQSSTAAPEPTGMRLAFAVLAAMCFCHRRD
jgi:hypothetical protein